MGEENKFEGGTDAGQGQQKKQTVALQGKCQVQKQRKKVIHKKGGQGQQENTDFLL